MNKATFLQSFKLAPLAASSQQFRYQLISKKPLRSAAVLIAIIEEADGLKVLLTRRAKHLKHHAGQISFPGGKVEEQDANLIETATREFEEEIGISASQLEIVGNLHPYQTISGFEVLPIVAFLNPPLATAFDEGEVDEVFYVPLSHCLDQSNHLHVNTQIKGKSYPVTFIPYQDYNIWGATAAMLKDFANHMSQATATV